MLGAKAGSDHRAVRTPCWRPGPELNQPMPDVRPGRMNALPPGRPIHGHKTDTAQGFPMISVAVKSNLRAINFPRRRTKLYRRFRLAGGHMEDDDKDRTHPIAKWAARLFAVAFVVAIVMKLLGWLGQS